MALHSPSEPVMLVIGLAIYVISIEDGWGQILCFSLVSGIEDAPKKFGLTIADFATGIVVT